MSTAIICNSTAYNADLLDLKYIQDNGVLLRPVAQQNGPDLIVSRMGRSLALMDSTCLQSDEQSFNTFIDRSVILVCASNSSNCIALK